MNTTSSRQHSVIIAPNVLSLHKKVSEGNIALDVLAKINYLMTKAENFESFCNDVSAILKNTFRFKYIQIWIPDKNDPKMLRCITPDETGASHRMPRDKGIVGRAIRLEKVVSQINVLEDPDYVNMHHDVKSELCIPFICENDILGALNIETSNTSTFKKHGDVLQMIADNLGHTLKVTLLHQTEKYFKMVVDQMSEGVWVGDLNEQTVYTNTALQNMLGMDAEEIKSKLSYELFDDESRAIIERENQKRKNGIKSNYEANLLSKAAEKIPVVLHAIPFDGGSMATITNLREITVAKERLKHAERYLASITKNCVDAIIGVDDNNKVASWNFGAERMYGYKDNEIIGKSITELLPQEIAVSEESRDILNEAKSKGFVRNHETVRVHKNGTKIPVLVTVSAIRDDSGCGIGYSILHKDITAEKKWQRELQGRFEKMQEAYREMGIQRRHLDYLVEILNVTLDETRSLEQIASFIVNAISMITKADAITLRLLNKDSGRLELLAVNGVGPDWWGKKSVKYEGSIVESAVNKKTPIKILDVINHPKYSSPTLARKKNLRSALVLPLLTRGSVLGSLTIYICDEKNLSLLDDEFIETLSKQAAITLSIAQQNRDNQKISNGS